MVLPIIKSMESLQGMLTTLSGGLTSITDTASVLGTVFGGAFDQMALLGSNTFQDIAAEVDSVKEKIESIGTSSFATAQQVSATDYADAITRGKIQQEQLAATAAAAASKQQAADVAAIQSKGTVNVTVNAGGITDRTDKKQMALEIGNEIQRELARFNAGLTRAPRL